jgi:hypothetical protein
MVRVCPGEESGSRAALQVLVAGVAEDGEAAVQLVVDVEVGRDRPKSRRARRGVPIPAISRDYLAERKLGSNGAAVFCGAAASKIAERGVAAMRAAGYEPLHVHDCRHTHAAT